MEGLQGLSIVDKACVREPMVAQKYTGTKVFAQVIVGSSERNLRLQLQGLPAILSQWEVLI